MAFRSPEMADNVGFIFASFTLAGILTYFIIAVLVCVANPLIETTPLLMSVMSVSRFITLLIINVCILAAPDDSDMFRFLVATAALLSIGCMALCYLINIIYYLYQQRNFHVKTSRLSTAMVVLSGDAYAPMKYDGNAVHGFIASAHVIMPVFQVICLAVMIPTENMYLRIAVILSIAVRVCGLGYQIVKNSTDKKNRPKFYVLVQFKTDDEKDIRRVNVATRGGKISEIHQRRAFESQYATLFGCKLEWVKFELFTVGETKSFHIIATHDIAFYSSQQPEMSCEVEEKRLHYMYRHEPAQMDLMELFKETFALEGNISGFKYAIEPGAASTRKRDFLRVLAEKGRKEMIPTRTPGDAAIVVYGNEEEKFNAMSGVNEVETPNFDDDLDDMYGKPARGNTSRQSRIEGMEKGTGTYTGTGATQGGRKGMKGSPRLSVIKSVDEKKHRRR